MLDIKTKAFLFFTSIIGLALLSIGIWALSYRTPIVHLEDPQVAKGETISSQAHGASDLLSPTQRIPTSALIGVLSGREEIKPPPTKTEAIPVVQPINGNKLIRYIGFVTNPDNSKSYYFKDLQKNILIKPSTNGEPKDSELIDSNDTIFTIRYGGTLYEVTKE